MLSELDDWGFGSQQGLGIFVFTTASKPALGPTQPPIQWVPGAISLVVKRGGVRLTTHLQLVPRPRMCGAIPPLSNTPSRRGAKVKAQGRLYLLPVFNQAPRH
jgi:hypothetical protein